MSSAAEQLGGMPELVLEYVLRQNGMEPFTDVEIVNNIDFTSTAGAFTGGIGSYTVEFEPTATALQNSGAGYISLLWGLPAGKFLTPFTWQMMPICRKSKVIEACHRPIYEWTAVGSPTQRQKSQKSSYPSSLILDSSHPFWNGIRHRIHGKRAHLLPRKL